MKHILIFCISLNGASIAALQHAKHLPVQCDEQPYTFAHIPTHPTMLAQNASLQQAPVNVSAETVSFFTRLDDQEYDRLELIPRDSSPLYKMGIIFTMLASVWAVMNTYLAAQQQ